MQAQTFLVELGTEELPPKALRTLAEAFCSNFTEGLTKVELPHGKIEWFASPRRMAIKVAELAAQQPDKVVEKRGPAIKACFDADGNATKAAQGWARGCGITVDQAERLKTDKGEWLLYKAQVAGKAATELLPELVSQALAKLPIPKPMRWGDYDTQFIRPVKTLTMLLGEQSIDATILGKRSATTIQGHRFMGEQFLEISHAEQYPKLFTHVMVDYEARKAKIKADVEAAAAAINGIADLEDELLEEVTSLVEWPVVLTASFENDFLNVPAEALVYTMKGDQKYFPVYDNDGNLMNKFIFVSNIESKDPAVVISGNEKVVRPRLADAEFFFNTDRKQKLEEQLPRLDSVLFQKQLGSLKDKTDRIQEMSQHIAGLIGANQENAARAGLLSKCDLMTSMVFEFTDTQGIMGMHYARHDGEAEEVAVALNEQYQPRYAGDDLPASGVAQALAIADKMDSLVGIFGIGQPPKADRDPFALRRAAIGVLRIAVEKDLPLDLNQLAEFAYGRFAAQGKLEDDAAKCAQTCTQVVDFMLARFRAWYQEAGFPVDVIQAVLAVRPTRPVDFDRRVKAVQSFRALDAAEALAAANKRVGNILAKVDGDIPAQVDVALLQEQAEKALAAKVETITAQIMPLYQAGDYQQGLHMLAELREPVDAFFENVMVNAEDAALRANRQALLLKLRQLFMQVGDISVLQQ
ncbi:glycine--tRNA ligase subunit beta [Ferrimonas lipolytica]|uniref:Glycine--tRNA ligase beta subunit n=1 Tax=Ferrimonas lipolytica TaxID=2724191 RepID=A0A6H1UGJ8_9GAMM|nr:glycine--tRNA ligase subunit beta [Ferrimonas lipolytica]QIZ78211.1 glycine--tRNA ligase subunit beta [Ferrimonas lipolytica]